MTFGKLKREIKKLGEIRKLSTGKYSEKDDIFIKSIIREFREYMKYLSPENREEFENYAKDYKSNLPKLIDCMNAFIPIVQPRYNESQRKNLRIKRINVWRTKK
ncbi:MAG: hypothetical protein HQ569_07395 [Actinobacteria bacterium]|nr:hypothetical protein [Actinomycetota bacterium]